jgi:hypothetical protein
LVNHILYVDEDIFLNLYLNHLLSSQSLVFLFGNKNLIKVRLFLLYQEREILRSDEAHEEKTRRFCWACMLTGGSTCAARLHKMEGQLIRGELDTGGSLQVKMEIRHVARLC